nr:hypothetical protein [Tanacetum cinerariifolium]
MANTTPIVTTVMKIAIKEMTPNGAKTASRINILDFYEEHYEDILPVMDKIRRDKRREVHTRLDVGENSRKSRRIREDSQNSSAKTLSARYRNPSERPQIWDRLRNNDGNVFGRLGHQKEIAFKRLSDTYSPSTTKSAPDREYSRDDSHNRGQIVLEADAAPTTSKYRMVDPFTPRIRNFKSSRKTRMPNNVKTYDVTGDPEDHVKIFQAAAQVERWAMPTWCHMFNSTLIGTVRDGETIEEFMERFKIKTERMKGAPECMRIFGFMHGINNPELIKRLNEHVPKTLEEMMTDTAAFIRGETAAASKKKVHTPWKSQDQSKRQNSERRSDFWSQPRDGRGSNKFTPLTRTPKEILAAESGKFKPPPPMKQKSMDMPYIAYTWMEAPRWRGRITLYKSMDGFYDSEVTITVQRHHWKAWDKRNPSSTILGSRNAQIPVKGEIVTIRSTILTPIECTTIAATPKDHAKKAEIRHENFKVAIHLDIPDQEITIGGTINKSTNETMHTLEEKLRYIRMAAVRHDRSPGVRQGNPSRGTKTGRGRNSYEKYTTTTGYPTQSCGETIWPLGQLRLLVIIGDVNHSTRAWMNFMVVRSLSPYNGIIRRLRIRAIQTVPSMLKTKIRIFQVQTSGSGISNLLAVATTFTGSGNLYCQWELLTWQWECLVHFIPNNPPLNLILLLHSSFPE